MPSSGGTEDRVEKRRVEKNARKNTYTVPDDRRDGRRVRRDVLALLEVRRVEVLRAVREEVEAWGEGEGGLACAFFLLKKGKGREGRGFRVGGAWFE